VIVSGATRLNLDPKRLELTGELSADRARLEIPEASRPRSRPMSSSLAGRRETSRSANVFRWRSISSSSWAMIFCSRGRAGRAAGRGIARIHGGPGAAPRPPAGRASGGGPSQVLRGEGTIRVETGRYAAYGQALDIERGQLRFLGPIDNPGLDVLAVRKTPTVKAGVQVGGTVQRPLVKLYSDPALPDSEKLSWLVLDMARRMAVSRNWRCCNSLPGRCSARRNR